jgi:hypothetical protein
MQAKLHAGGAFDAISRARFLRRPAGRISAKAKGGAAFGRSISSHEASITNYSNVCLMTKGGAAFDRPISSHEGRGVLGKKRDVLRLLGWSLDSTTT